MPSPRLSQEKHGGGGGSLYEGLWIEAETRISLGRFGAEVESESGGRGYKPMEVSGVQLR